VIRELENQLQDRDVIVDYIDQKEEDEEESENDRVEAIGKFTPKKNTPTKSYIDISGQLCDVLGQFIADIHLRGINLRYLMIMYQSVVLESTKVLLGTEMVVRCMKNQLREKWRSLKTGSETAYVDTTIQFINHVLLCKLGYLQEVLSRTATHRRIYHKSYIAFIMLALYTSHCTIKTPK